MPIQPRDRSRRVLPEPVETSSRSSKDKSSISSEGGTSRSPACPDKQRPRHSHGPQEQGHSISSLLGAEEDCRPGTLPQYKLEPHPAIRVNGTGLAREPSQRHKPSLRGNQPLGGNEMSQRRFVPQLMETGKRSFRRQPTLDPLSPQEFPWSKQVRASESSNISNATEAYVNAPSESRFSYASLRQRHETRRHSFRVPSLSAIPSSCSEASTESPRSSPRASPDVSPVVRPDRTNPRDTRRESCDERVANYLLSLAARTAEMQLQEQALAAFPNEQVYQPVDHFAIDREEDDDSYAGKPLAHGQDGETRGRRTSSADMSWELEYMRQHKVDAEMRDRAMAGTNGPHTSHFGVSKYTPLDNTSGLLGNKSAMPNVTRMRHAESPPMLGADLIFPQSLSPESTIYEGSTDFEIGHGPRDSSGLWHATSHNADSFESYGLWMGTCQMDNCTKNSVPVTVMPVMRGVATGQGAHCDELKSVNHNSRRQSLDGCSHNGDGKYLRSEQHLSPESNDEFVTQIYNYLSLGYPCVARYYDQELSKVSGIPLPDLRRDDLNTDAKGYVRVTDYMEKHNFCMRWKALRIYIHECVKEQPAFREDGSTFETWGVRERRGSWAG